MSDTAERPSKRRCRRNRSIPDPITTATSLQEDLWFSILSFTSVSTHLILSTTCKTLNCIALRGDSWQTWAPDVKLTPHQQHLDDLFETINHAVVSAIRIERLARPTILGSLGRCTNTKSLLIVSGSGSILMDARDLLVFTHLTHFFALGITFIGPFVFSALPKLTHVSLSASIIAMPDPASSGISHVTHLSFHFCAIKDNRWLTLFPHLEVFRSIQTSLCSLEGFESHASIRHVAINRTFVTSLEPLKNCQKLERVFARYTNISSVDCLVACNNLKHVDVRDSDVRTIGRMAERPDVECLFTE